MQNYKDLKVWEKAHQFTLMVYDTSKLFPKEEIYGLTNQLRRAASSIPANIAEGCGKSSNPDFAKCLNISLGSANEAEYFILLAKDLSYMNVEKFDMLYKQINVIKAMLIGLIAKVRP
ncbi:MAG: four helix bundle protein [Ferruginibacter sp.]|nr:four helix bundle protein [Ferruginibacter sp.]